MIDPTRPTDAPLLERLQTKWKASRRGAPPGIWSVTKAALALLEYRELGGGWTGGTPA